MKIHIDTCAGNRGYIPCCPCLIVAEDGRDILVQSDWDYPGFASTFGWSVRNVQKCLHCGKILTVDYSANMFACADCDGAVGTCCDHDSTDGTVDCRACGATATDFISAAYDYLRYNDGAEAEDPGYFAESE